MQVVDLHLNNEMEVIKFITRRKNSLAEEFNFPEFPYLYYDLLFEHLLTQRIQWHWHYTVEFLEIISGNLCIRTNQHQHHLKAGDICFINAHSPHSLDPESDPSECICRTHQFDTELISGGWNTALDTHYIHPILDNRRIDLYHFEAGHPETEKIRGFLEQAITYQKPRSFGYEFDVRHCITSVWRILLETARSTLPSRQTIDDRSDERVQIMLSFIRKNYNLKIELAEIADAATISERECFRCFQKTLGVTPIHYLQMYRIRMAARMLLETRDSIQSISQAVGFSDTSYFGKTFQKYMHCSPTEFRKTRYTDYE